MQNFCSLPATTHKCLVCKFPSCNCEKCSQLRAEGKPDQDEMNKCLSSLNETNLSPDETNGNITTTLEDTTHKVKNLLKGTVDGLRKVSMPTLNFTPTNLESVLFDIVGIISFFIMATIMFWVTVSQYLWQFIKLIFQSGRRPQLIAIILLLLLCISITFHAIKGKHYRQTMIKSTNPKLSQNSTNNFQPPKYNNNFKSCQRKRCSHCNLKTTKNVCGSKENLLEDSASFISISSKQENPSLCDLCAKHVKNENKSPTILSEDEVREMYKRFKFYSIPSEMKSPPSLSNLMDFLTGLYNTISGSITR